MMYREYKEKLEKRKRTFDRLWLFRYLFLALFLFLLATTGALLGIGGMVYDVEVIPGLAAGELPAFVYGQTPSPAAKSIYGEARFEYRALPDGVWTGETPYLAGEYECRAVGTSVAHTDRPGKSFPFVIAPLAVNINVEGASLVYGDIPEFHANLLYGDTLQVENWVSEPENGRLNISADLSSVTVLDKEGRDVTFCYDFKAEIKNVEDKNRPAVVGLESETLTYDGEAHSLSCYAKGLAEGDTLKAEAPAFTDAGNYTQTFLSYTIVDAAGEDVTAHYKITEQIGTLTILRRPMSVTTLSNSWVYDGAPHSEEGFEGEALGEERGLLEGHTAQAVGVPAITNVRESGKMNAFAVQISNGTEDVTQNYQISYTYGTLAVTKRPITVTTETETLTYDGAEHEYPVTEDYLTEGTLPTGHELTQTGTLTVKNAGTYPNRPMVSVYEGNVNRTQNYQITYDYGKVTVEKRAVAVTTASDTFTYDGLAHEYDEETLTLGEIKLAEGEAFVLTGTYSFTDAATYTNAPAVKVYAGGEETTSNYALTVTHGKITIKTRPMSVTTHSNSWVYDAIEHNEEGFDTQEEDAEGGLLSSAGHTAEVATRKFIEKVAESGQNEFEIKVSDGVGADVTHNYSIAYQYGTLTINARPMSVTTHENSWVYDGAPHSESGFDAQEAEGEEVSGLISFHHAVAGEAPAVTNVAESGTENKFEIQILDETNRDVTQNYQIVSYTYGTLSVTKRPITVRTQPKAWVYDAKQHSYYGFTVDEGVDCGLAPMQTAQVDTNETKIKTVSENGENGKDNVFTVKILDAEQNDVTENYEFTYVYGELTIVPRPIRFETATNAWVYDARPHADGGLTYEAETEDHRGLVTGQEVRIVGTAPQVTNVRDTHPNNNVFAVRIFESSESSASDVSENYSPTFIYGTLTIMVRPMSVTTHSNSWIYDADRHSEEGFTAQEEGTDCGLLEVHTAEVLTRKFIQTVDESGENEFEIYVLNGERADVTENYQITYTYGTLEIQKRPIQVTTKGQRWVYDAQYHSYGAFDTETESTGRGLLASKGHTATALDPPTVKTITQVDKPNIFQVKITDDLGAEVTQNYDISYTYGMLSLSARPVIITTHSEEWIYDGLAHAEPTAEGEAEGKDRGLIPFHRVEASDEAPSVTNVWDTEEKNNIFKVRIFEGDVDVTHNYRIDYVYGTLRVAPRPIQLKTATAAWIYDAESHSDGGVAVVTENTPYALVAGHKLERTVEASVKLPFLIDVGTKENEFAFTWKVFAGEDDMSRNYVLLSENGILYGTLKVDPRPLQLQTATKSWVYDDTAHSDSGVTVTKESKYQLVAGHTLSTAASALPTITEVGDRENQFTFTWKVFAGEVDVTKNYTITRDGKNDIVYGKIAVTPRHVTLRTGSDTWQYDGLPHTVEKDFSYEVENGALEGHEFKWLFRAFKDVQVPEQGKFYENTLTGWSVSAGGRDVTRNYALSKQTTYGKVEVTPAPLTVKSQSGEWVYDGEPHQGDGKITLEGLVNDQKIFYTNHGPSITDVGEVENKMGFVILPNISGDAINQRNYDITYEWGTLTVTARHVTITTPDGTWTYDGMPHSNPEAIAEAQAGDRGLLTAKWHYPVAIDPTTVVGVKDSCQNEFEVLIYDGSGNDVTENYAIEYDYAGVLTIEKREATVTTNSHTWVYSEGEEYYDDGFVAEWQDGDRGILYGYSVGPTSSITLVAITDSDTEIGTVQNIFEVIISIGETDYTDNYEINYVYGDLRVKAPIVVRLSLYKVEYDGTPHTYNENGKTRYKVMSVPVDVKKEQVKFDEDYSALTQVTPVVMGAEDLREAFSLDVGPAEVNRIDFTGSATPFVVSPRTIVVTSQSISLVQTASVTQIDGSYVRPGSDEKPYGITRGSLLEGHTLSCEVTGVLYSGWLSQDNTFNTDATKILDADGNDVTSYYNITYKTGTLRWLT